MIRPVSYATILEDPNWPALLAEYSAECALPELGEPSPQRGLYELLEKSGGFQAFGEYQLHFDEDRAETVEKLVGFACVLIYSLPHYGTKIATSESIFVSSRWRNTIAGIEVREAIKEHAIQSGCVAFLYTAPKGSQFDKLLDMTCRHTNNVYLEAL
jgi:hypothetical protein